jgi:1-acyl-sn-glycerol-3-phosphate acyltransferase
LDLNHRTNWIRFKPGKIGAWLLKCLGWRANFEGLPATHVILVVYPHTSNLDFLIGILFKWATGLPAQYLAKDSLFKIPMIGSWLRYVGGRPVVRNSPQGYVAELAQEMAKSEHFWLVITPEGTRKKTPGWRTGFYHLALETGYPIGFAYIDYSKKELGFTEFAYMTGDEEKDILLIQKKFEGKIGRFPQNMSPIQFWSPPDRKKGV